MPRPGGRYAQRVDDSPEIYENMSKALAILTAWNESGDGDLSLVEQATLLRIMGQRIAYRT